MPGTILETWHIENLRTGNNLYQDAAKTTLATMANDRVDTVVGSAHDLISDDGGRRPTLRTSGFNSNASLEFDSASTQRLWKDPFPYTSGAAGYCVYLVAKYDINMANNFLFGITDGAFNTSANYSVGVRTQSGFFEGYVGTAQGDKGHDQVGGSLAQDTNEHLFVMYWNRNRGTVLFIDGQYTFGREAGAWVRGVAFPPRATAGLIADRFHLGGGPVGNDSDCTIAYVQKIEMTASNDEWDRINGHSSDLMTEFGITRATAMI